MLERVPVLQLQDMDLYVPGPRETRITCWAHVMLRGGGGQPISWGMLFREDPDMLLPVGEQSDEEGKHLIETPHYLCVLFFMMILDFTMHMS